MIKQNELLDKWLARQAENPPKMKLALRESGAFCCLGNLCEAAGLRYSEKSLEYDFDGRSVGNILEANWANRNLNVTVSVSLTISGSRIAKIFLRENNIEITGARESAADCLANINDSTTADHVVIGQLIAHLAMVEKRDDIECFKEGEIPE